MHFICLSFAEFYIGGIDLELSNELVFQTGLILSYYLNQQVMYD